MKKKLSLLLVLAMVLSLCAVMSGCANNNTSNQLPDSSAEYSQPNDVTPPDDEGTPDVQKPAEPDEPDVPPLPEITVEDIVTTMKVTYGDKYLPNMPLDAESLEFLMGITPDMYDEFYGEFPMISTHVDRLVVVKTQNTEEVTNIFTNYKQKLIDETMQYPMNVPKVNSATVYGAEDYVIFFILGAYLDEAEDEVAATNYAVEQRDIGIEALNELFRTRTVPEAPEVIEEDVENNDTEPSNEADVGNLEPETPDNETTDNVETDPEEDVQTPLPGFSVPIPLPDDIPVG